MTLPKKITRAWLNKHSACSSATYDFNKLFPDGVVVSLESIRKLTKAQRAYVKDHFEWFSERFGVRHNQDVTKCFCKNPNMRKQLEGIGYKF